MFAAFFRCQILSYACNVMLLYTEYQQRMRARDLSRTTRVRYLFITRHNNCESCTTIMCFLDCNDFIFYIITIYDDHMCSSYNRMWNIHLGGRDTNSGTIPKSPKLTKVLILDLKVILTFVPCSAVVFFSYCL